jgi:hypothetical protein
MAPESQSRLSRRKASIVRKGTPGAAVTTGPPPVAGTLSVSRFAVRKRRNCTDTAVPLSSIVRVSVRRAPLHVVRG